MKTYDVMRTHRDYVVDAPDKDGEIEIEVEEREVIWLNKQDLLDMLTLFDSSHRSTLPEKDQR
jgi:hypothetical protein